MCLLPGYSKFSAFLERVFKYYNTLVQTTSRKILGMATPTQHLSCDLPEQIHPILARKNWVCHEPIKKVFWQELQPALRLATQMLNEDKVLLWWTHLLFGEPTQSPSSQGTYLRRTAKSWNPAAINDVKKYLTSEAPGRIKLTFQDTTDMLPYGLTAEGWDIIRKTMGLKKGIATIAKVHIEHEGAKAILTVYNAAFRRYFESGARSCRQDIFTSFLLGITIIHELVHAIYVLRRKAHSHTRLIRSALCESAHEPYFYDPAHSVYREERAELGWCLEDYLFGLRFHATLDPKDGALWLKHCSSYLYTGDRSTYERYVATDPKSVVGFFSQKKWKEIHGTEWKFVGSHLVPTVSHWPSMDTCGWKMVWIPNAALINKLSDGLFTYVL